MNRLVKAFLFILACEAFGNIGTIFTIQSIPTWYATLIKPSFTPPNWLFGPVWTTLFALMGVSTFLVYEGMTKRNSARTALYAFDAQFIINVLWSFLFFGLRSISLGLIDILALWIAIAITIFMFYKISKLSALLLVPYIVWVSIATLLNYYVFVLN